MKIENRKPYWFTSNGVKTIEEKYNAKYMGYWCSQRPSGGWNEQPVDVFYVENPDTSKGHTNYFGMFVRDGMMLITDASSCFEEHITGLEENGTVYVSRYRHDFVQTPLGSHIDGGRDYIKSSSPCKLVNVIINGDKFEFSEIKDISNEEKQNQ